ncbi:MAG: hypothetical protein F6K00_25565 [Leptolyngbya sp. SIOISBB]|nr:hypothetical protein [Leptolyngbya sp. SIOISBB]
MNGKSLYAGTDYFQTFPNPQDVFIRDVEEHSKYLLPVATFSLSHISPKWSGKVHFILPIEPVGGYGFLGTNSGRYHNYLCRPDWIGYKYHGDKCELASDFRFFHRAFYEKHPPNTDLQKNEASELPGHYKQTLDRFAIRKQHFEEHGWLCSDPLDWDPLDDDSDDDPEEWRSPFVSDLGGTSFDSNWSNSGSFPVSRYPDKLDGDDWDRVLPNTEDGRDFTFIGAVDMWNFIGDSNGTLLLFFDPDKHIALTTIDWS